MMGRRDRRSCRWRRDREMVRAKGSIVKEGFIIVICRRRMQMIFLQLLGPLWSNGRRRIKILIIHTPSYERGTRKRKVKCIMFQQAFYLIEFKLWRRAETEISLRGLSWAPEEPIVKVTKITIYYHTRSTSHILFSRRSGSLVFDGTPFLFYKRSIS